MVSCHKYERYIAHTLQEKAYARLFVDGPDLRAPTFQDTPASERSGGGHGMKSVKVAAIVVAGGALIASCGGIYPVVSAQGGSEPVQIAARSIRLGVGPPGGSIGASVRDVEGPARPGNEPTAHGAEIDSVRGESPAARAGLRPDDIIVELDGERVRSARQLARLISETPPGRTVKAVVVRDGQPLDVELTPEARSDSRVLGPWMEGLERLGRDVREMIPHVELPEVEVQILRRPGRLGVRVHELSSQLAEYFGVRTGVLVASVLEDSPAAEAGVKAGDVITTVDGWTVNDPRDLRGRVESIEDGKDFTIGLVRDRRELTETATIAEPQESPRRAFRQPV